MILPKPSSDFQSLFECAMRCAHVCDLGRCLAACMVVRFGPGSLLSHCAVTCLDAATCYEAGRPCPHRRTAAPGPMALDNRVRQSPLGQPGHERVAAAGPVGAEQGAATASSSGWMTGQLLQCLTMTVTAMWWAAVFELALPGLGWTASGSLEPSPTAPRSKPLTDRGTPMRADNPTSCPRVLTRPGRGGELASLRIDPSRFMTYS